MINTVNLPLCLGLIIALPLAAAPVVLFIPARWKKIKGLVSCAVTMVTLLISVLIYKNDFSFSMPWIGFGLDLSFRLYPFSAFIVTATQGFGVLVSLFSIKFMEGRQHEGQFYSYFLITLGLTSGAVFADNLLLLLFFWEGLLLVLFGMIAIGGKEAFRAATKAFIINGITDLCMMSGILLSGYLAHTFMISKMNIPAIGTGAFAFVLVMIGAISKSGSMPFHTWIPDAAGPAPLPFMAFVPGALEKLLGIYFLTRITLDIFKLSAHSTLSVLLMWIGGLTLLFAVMMALIQKNYKRLLSYHAISQVGYMILGVGTALPVGIVGGLFHMINNAIYKSGLFLTAGSVEKQTGSSALEELGGLGRRMPLTFICFIITALSISGVWPFNGFFSKEYIYDAALERGLVFYLMAAIGSFFTAASFLKLGHAAFLGNILEKNKKVKESPVSMLIPMVILAAFCIFFGLFHTIPVNKILSPIVQASYSGPDAHFVFNVSSKLAIITFIVLVCAVLNHLLGTKLGKGGLHASDHIRNAPGLAWIYTKAERRWFDPYEIGLKFVKVFSKISLWLDRKVNWVYDVLAVRLSYGFGSVIRKAHTVSYPSYLVWCLLGFIAVTLFLIH
ncbi:MAG: proton-conducting transporter membrane subunit [Candidatus Omnitrophota bacterium]|jgi:NADH-quinone oxidoreductase subunit L